MFDAQGTELPSGTASVRRSGHLEIELVPTVMFRPEYESCQWRKRQVAPHSRRLRPSAFGQRTDRQARLDLIVGLRKPSSRRDGRQWLRVLPCKPLRIHPPCDKSHFRRAAASTTADFVVRA